MTSQVVHGLVKCHSTAISFRCSFVYAFNDYVERRALWADLLQTSLCWNEEPWIIGGDFNAIRVPSDRIGGSSVWNSSHDEFADCLHQAQLEDLPYTGARYTWSSSSGLDRKQSKIDRVLINGHWSNAFSFSQAEFLPPGISDHSPMVVRICQSSGGNKPFKFFQFWTTHPRFSTIVQQAWALHCSGSHMFVLSRRLKKLKLELKKLNRESFSDISSKVLEIRSRLHSVQSDLLNDPYNRSLADMENDLTRQFSELRLQEESFYRQKSRLQWLKEGDRNTKFFHSTVKQRCLRNRILAVQDDNGTMVDNPEVIPQLFVSHFQHLLSDVDATNPPTIQEVRSFIHHPLTEQQVASLSLPISDEEIKNTMFSLASNKAPGPDGFTADFFKFCWEIVGGSVILAVQEFFATGSLLREVNGTILALIPKCPNASSVHDFRPIACCNTVYKCISKLIAHRLAAVLPALISPEQNAFIQGRRICDNILLAQELFSGFHLAPYLPKSVVKVDFRKAYDTVDWRFLRVVLLAFGFPVFLVDRIMTCVSTAKFSISMNGTLHGYFQSSRGIRQGDPMSPYLFTLVMEIFSGILHHNCGQPEFGYFWRCKKTLLSHLFFADDVLLFSEANAPSLGLLMDGITQFSSWSGLFPNPNKSQVFFSGVAEEDRSPLLEILGFQVGTFPITYLGLPIITTRLRKVDCVVLVNAITARIRSWTQRFLSYGGRLQLIRSVLYSIHVFWAQVFILPKSVLDAIEKIVRQFLWKGPGLGVGGAKVSWSDIGFPKQEGGLGIRRLRHWNNAMLCKHIWTLFVDKESLWCRWIHSNFLKGVSFWVAKEPTFCSWAWRKLLQLRPSTVTLFKWEIGTGNDVSFWFDNWHPRGPLHLLFSDNERKRAGLSIGASVADFVGYSGRRTRTLNVILGWRDPIPATAGADTFSWTGSTSGLFSTSSAWDHFRIHKPAVPWASFVWDTTFPPRYQFHLWLLSKNRLPTQVLLLSYGRIPYTTCAFCHACPDSIDHLYFACNVTHTLALYWAGNCNLPWCNSVWHVNLAWLSSHTAGAAFGPVLSRYAFAALCYIIWKERNDMLFRGKILLLPILKKRLDRLVKDFALRFTHVPDTQKNNRLQRSWGLPTSIFGRR